MDRYVSLAEQAYDFLRNMIKSGRLKQNEVYSETKLSKEIGVSRTPMRDALMRLSQDKYIDILPSKGFRLHKMTKSDIWNTYQIRTAIEGFCAMNLQQQRNTEAGRETICAIKTDLNMMKDAIDKDASYETILSYDLDFHDKMVKFTDNPDMIALFESYKHLLSDIAFKSFEKQGRPLEAYHEHKEIYQMLAAEDEETVQQLYHSLMRHMEASRDIALKLIEEEQTRY